MIGLHATVLAMVTLGNNYMLLCVLFQPVGRMRVHVC